MRKFYIVIPTKNRSATLYYSIKTALAQDYENLEVIVSDNCSSDDTKGVFDSFKDSRLRYQRSDRPLAMINSWEFALSAVNGAGYVHFMGDDNGLVPNAVEYVNQLIDSTGVSIVHGDVIQYKWPGLENDFGEISVPIARGVMLVDSKKALANAYKLKIGFSRLPTINIAFVHTDVIEFAKKINGGRYFCASNPDVYSALLNSFSVKKYCYSKTPFVINGASAFSNGGTTQQAQGVSAFVSDNLNDGYVYHRSFPPSTAYHLNVYEAYAIAAEKFDAVGEKFDLPMRKIYHSLVKKEYLKMNRLWLKNDIEEFSRLNNIKACLPDFAKPQHVANKPNSLNNIQLFNGESFFARSRDRLFKNVFNVSNVACVFLSFNPQLKINILIENCLSRLKWKVRAFFMGARTVDIR